MDWKLINSGSNTGKYNMEFDLQLVNSCDDKTAILRFYRWSPYCISLGANQSYNDIDINTAAADNVDVVARPTGGRAILHAEELTYSVIMPIDKEKMTAKKLYEEISLALVEGLRNYSPKLNGVELESQQPHFPSLLKKQSGVLCFASTAKSEVKFMGKKIIGSAQRKIGNKILQHGSILCGSFHRKLPEYLNVSDEAKPLLLEELNNHTIEIEEITNEPTEYAKLTECIINSFEDNWGINFIIEDPISLTK
jgi:lipoate-protein ligase A